MAQILSEILLYSWLQPGPRKPRPAAARSCSHTDSPGVRTPRAQARPRQASNSAPPRPAPGLAARGAGDYGQTGGRASPAGASVRWWRTLASGSQPPAPTSEPGRTLVGGDNRSVNGWGGWGQSPGCWPRDRGKVPDVTLRGAGRGEALRAGSRLLNVPDDGSCGPRGEDGRSEGGRGDSFAHAPQS